MSRRAFIACLFAFLLLAAQQGALLHAVWHAHDGRHAHQHDSHEHDGHAHGDQAPSGHASLCMFDLAFGQVLGGAHDSGLALTHVPVTVERLHDITAPRLLAEALTPKSRGPPALL